MSLHEKLSKMLSAAISQTLFPRLDLYVMALKFGGAGRRNSTRSLSAGRCIR